MAGWLFQRHRNYGPRRNMSSETEEALFASLAQILEIQGSEQEALTALLGNQRYIMADLSNLKAALAANTQAVSDLQAEVARLKDISGTDQAAVDEITTGLTTNTSAMEALKPPPPPPPPAPEAAVTPASS